MAPTIPSPLSANRITFVFFLLILISANPIKAQQYTRGIGVYPGDPKEIFQ